jgi:hypothetical protein
MGRCRYVSRTLRQSGPEFSVSFRYAGTLPGSRRPCFAVSTSFAAWQAMGLSLSGQCGCLLPAAWAEPAALPSHTVTGGGARVAPQRCPILRTGILSIVQSSLLRNRAPLPRAVAVGRRPRAP